MTHTQLVTSVVSIFFPLVFNWIDNIK
jgi:hypothetical protein